MIFLRIKDEKCFNFDEDIKSEQFWYLNEIRTIKSSWKFVNLGGVDFSDFSLQFLYFDDFSLDFNPESFSYSHQIHQNPLYWLHAAQNPSIPS